MTTKDFGQIFSEYNEIQDEIIGALADTKFDNVTYNSDDGMIRFYSGEEELMAIGPIKGGGGGGGGTATFNAVNTTGWIQKKISKDSQDLIVSFNWSSIE